MHEGLIGVLNRRFINCYFNAHVGPGADPTVGVLLEEIGVDPASLSYGAIITPEGKRLSSFGFSQQEFYQRIVDALEEHPEFAEITPSEAEVFAQAEENPGDVRSQLAAAQIRLELLDFDGAEAICDEFLVRPGISDEDRARALAMKAHVTLLDLRSDRRSLAREILMSIESAPEDIADGIAIDLIACDVTVAPTQAFYGGWQMEPAAALRHERTIHSWLERDTESNRRGEMLFYLGLARLAQDDQEGADAAWKRHVRELPEDRYAMLSRIHHSGYVFSPTGGSSNVMRSGGGNMVVDPRSRIVTGAESSVPEVDLRSLLERIQSQGGRLRIQGDKVFVGDEQLPEDEARALLESLGIPDRDK